MQRSTSPGWYILGVTPMQTVFRDVVTASLVATGLVMVVLILSAVLCLHLARRLNSPIQAITRIMRTGKADTAEATVETEEFQYILSVFQSMREQNEKLDRMKRETGYAAKQDYLNALLSESFNLSSDQAMEKLHSLNMNYVAQNPLCMCLLKIDNYSDFESKTSQKERWAMRYAIVNIAAEIAEDHVVCETFCSDHDKFVMLVDCHAMESYKDLQERVEAVLRLVQKSIRETLEISLSAAYSTRFTGLEHLPSMYNAMRDSILLKIRYGHGCIIAPHLMDELESDDFRAPSKKESLLIQKVLEGDAEAALGAYADISGPLYQHSYNEIISCQVHLVYTIYSTALEKKPALKADTDFVLQSFLQDIQNAETGDDIDGLMQDFLQRICLKIERLNGETQSGGEVVVQRVVEIVQQQYPDPGLCLSSIAEQLRLSPNYIGYLFKSTRQQSISQYIYELRMEKLDDYMRTTKLSLSAILDKVGLEKNNYFYTKFKKHFGMSLGEYKLQLSADTAEEDSTV
ncbi:helix-turn-helix transcriptional regulator [Ruminococcaceae bacterium OttesenSCG-928-D13]|nr:helix-turn-helix transcriptional regulator [Ruminococcaceae bacterium OttesenSCG-928-D13]